MIRTRLHVVTAISLALVISIGLVVSLTSRGVNQAIARDRVASEVVKGVAELRLLALEYLLHREARARTQWRARHASLATLLGAQQGAGAARDAILAEIRDEHEDVKRLFARLVENYEAREAARDSALFRELEARLVGHLAARTQDMLSDALRLRELSYADVTSAQRRASTLVLACVVGIGASLALTAFWLTRSVFRPIFRLEQGTRRIAAGPLNHSIRITSRDEIGRLSRAFDDMTARLRGSHAELETQYREAREASRLKSEFLANMSHELRTPLNAIIGFAQLIHDGKAGPVNPEQKEFLGDVLTGSRHLVQLVNDVLDLAKVESGRLEFQPVPVDPERLVGEVRDIVRSLAAAKRIRITTAVDPTLGPVVTDPARLKQVLYNYVSNALKFTGDEGRVAIRVGPEGAEAFRLEVEDTGIGIRPEDIGRLFVEFQQLDSTAAKQFPGTGLGLALTKRIVEAQGGRVGVRSTPGVGSTFFAVLPRLAPERVEPEAAPAIPPLPAARPAAPTVLVIEDNPSDRGWLTRLLAEAGYAVESAATGAEAVDLAQSRRFDAITLDLLLPDIDGQDVLRRLRSAPRNRETPVIVVSVAVEARHALAFQVQEILAKPVEATALLAALEGSGVRPDGRPVLVVDDDPQTLKLAETTLRGLGYRPLCRPDGDSALEAAAAEPPAAVVLDLIMPGMTGFEFLDRFQRMLSPRIPVIVWTAKDLSREERARLRGRSHAIVVKSDGPQALLDQLALHISTPRPAGTPGSSDAR